MPHPQVSVKYPDLVVCYTSAVQFSPVTAMASSDFTPPDRIRELSAINADVAFMLTSAGHAINALTNRPLNHMSDSDEDTEMTNGNPKVTLEDRKDAFKQHSTAYYTHLQAIVARLRRQAYALEEAGIISPEANEMLTVKHAPPMPGPPGRGPPPAPPQPERIENNGLGSHEIGWLNSRANNVGAEKEKELVADARELLEDVLAQRSEG
jgi:hypothetical protein